MLYHLSSLIALLFVDAMDLGTSQNPKNNLERSLGFEQCTLLLIYVRFVLQIIMINDYMTLIL